MAEDQTILEWASNLLDKIPELHPFWQWAGLGIAIVCAVMALPTFLQMFFGRPKLRLDYAKHQTEEFTSLQVYVHNDPIDSRLLKKLGVRREDTEIMFDVSIYPEGSINPIVEYSRIKINSEQGEESSLRSRIGGSYWGVVAPIYYYANGESAIINDYHDPRPINEGHYSCKITVWNNGKCLKGQKRFYVSHNPSGMYWKN